MRSERGNSLSVFVTVVVAALLLVTGLVVDGGQQSAAKRRAELIAAAAARVAADTTATDRVAGRSPDLGAAISAAKRHLASDPTIAGTVQVRSDGSIVVETSTSVDTIYLGVIGITRLTATGTAEAQLFGG